MSTLVAGIDCSTQSTKVLVCDAETGQVVRSGSAPHPDATEVDPAVWAAALDVASAGGFSTFRNSLTVLPSPAPAGRG